MSTAKSSKPTSKPSSTTSMGYDGSQRPIPIRLENHPPTQPEIMCDDVNEPTPKDYDPMRYVNAYVIDKGHRDIGQPDYDSSDDPLLPGTAAQAVRDAVDNDELFSEGPHEAIGRQIGRMVDSKQRQYGDSFGRCGAVLRVLYPNGVTVDQYDDLLAIARIVDKLFRIATNHPTDTESPYQDIAGYGILGTFTHQEGSE